MANNFNVSLKIFFRPEIQEIYEICGKEFFMNFVKIFTVLVKENNFYVQINNKPLTLLFEK